jgi:hypothetical protein
LCFNGRQKKKEEEEMKKISKWTILDGKERIVATGGPCSFKGLENNVTQALEDGNKGEGTFTLFFMGSNGEKVTQKVMVKKQYTVDFGE